MKNELSLDKYAWTNICECNHSRSWHTLGEYPTLELIKNRSWWHRFTKKPNKPCEKCTCRNFALRDNESTCVNGHTWYDEDTKGREEFQL